jgi:hypothetical protein
MSDRASALLTEMYRGLPHFSQANSDELFRLSHDSFFQIVPNSSFTSHSDVQHLYFEILTQSQNEALKEGTRFLALL